MEKEYSSIMDLFDFEKAAPIEYNEKWSNGTGYYNGAVNGTHAPKLSIGEMRKCISKNDRKILLVGTRYGNVAIFQRYSGGDRSIVVANMPKEVENYVGGGDVRTALRPSTIERLIGYDMRETFSFPNIGKAIEEYHASVA